MNGYFPQLLRQTGVRYGTAAPPDATGAEVLNATSAIAAPLDSKPEVCRMEPFSPGEETYLPGEGQVGEQPPSGGERHIPDPHPYEQAIMVEPDPSQGNKGHKYKLGYKGQGRAMAFLANNSRSDEGSGPASPDHIGPTGLASSPDGPALVQLKNTRAGAEPVVPRLNLESDLDHGAGGVIPPWERDALREKPTSNPRHQWHKAMEEARKWVAESSGVGEFNENSDAGTGLKAGRGARTTDFRGDAPVPGRRRRERDQGLEPQSREFHLSIGTIALTIEKPPDIRPELQPRPTRGDQSTGGDAPRSRLIRHYLRIR